MSNFDDISLFGNTTLSDIFKQIAKNNKDVNKKIEELTEKILLDTELGIGYKIELMPVVKDLIDVNVKNNDQLIKMAAIASKTNSTNSSAVNDFINPDEIQALLENQKEVVQEVKEHESKITTPVVKINNA